MENNEIQEESEDLNECIDRQAAIICDQAVTIKDIAAIVANAANWSTPELVAFNRGYILGMASTDIDCSFTVADDENPVSH